MSKKTPNAKKESQEKSKISEKETSSYSADDFWKVMIEKLFEDFMYFFYEKDAERIDFSKGYTFLDKEFQKLFPHSETQNRRVDKLVKIFTKEGKEEWILIHIEIQGYYDKNMAYRIFTYFYRITDKHHKPVSTMVIYTDDNPNFHPKEYVQECMGTELKFSFNTWKLLEYPPKPRRKKKNIFAYVMEMAWYGLKRNKLNDKDLLKYKTFMVKQLAKAGFSDEKIYYMIEFIRFFVPFEKPEFIDKFEENIQPITKINEIMSMQELVQNIKKKEGIELTLKVIDLLKAGKTVEEISSELSLPIRTIELIKSRL